MCARLWLRVCARVSVSLSLSLSVSGCVFVCLCMCVRLCVCARVRDCVRTRARAYVRVGEALRRQVEELQGQLAEASARTQQAQAEGEAAQERLAAEQTKWQQREHEWKLKLEAHATELGIPKYAAMLASVGDGGEAGRGSYRTRASGAGGPMPGDVLLEIALNVTLEGLGPEETQAVTHGVAQHVANAIGARRDTWRVLGVETEASPPVLHLALQHDVCYPAQTALEAGNEALRQLSDANSLLLSGQHAAQVAGIKVSECGVDRVGANALDQREQLLRVSRSSFTRRSSTLTAEDLAHCGSAKCSALIQGLNRHLEEALFELSQLHKEAYHRAKLEDERVKQYAADLSQLQVHHKSPNSLKNSRFLSKTALNHLERDLVT